MIVDLMANDTRDMRLVCSKLLGNSSLACATSVELAHCRNLCRSKATPRPSFCNHIFHVVKMGTCKQVGRIATGRIVAMMTNENVVCNRAVSRYIGVAMRARVLYPIPKDTVSTVTARRSPFPALIRAAFVYLFPKAFRWSLIPSSSMPICKSGLSSWDGAWIYRSTASAGTVANRLFVRLLYSLLGIVPNDESSGLPFDDSSFGVIFVRNWRGLAATAFTKFWGVCLCVHRANFTTFYTSGAWQMAVNLSEATG
jgi:hypothetical protein